MCQCPCFVGKGERWYDFAHLVFVSCGQMHQPARYLLHLNIEKMVGKGPEVVCMKFDEY